MDAVGTALCRFAQAIFGNITIGDPGTGFTAALTYGVLGIGVVATVLGIAGIITKNLGITSLLEVTRFFGGGDADRYGGRAESLFHTVQENGLSYTLGGMAIAVFYQYLGPMLALAIKAIITGVGMAFGGAC